MNSKFYKTNILNIGMMKGIERILKEKGKQIEKEIEKVIPREGIKNLNDVIWYHLGTGGKRIRPVLAILTCESLGGDVRKVLPFASACELLHNWLLIHDDIEDRDEVRRNKPTVWKKFGLDHGINVGDFMSEKVYELILKSEEVRVDKDTIMKLLKETVETSTRTSQGQTMDMNLRKNNNPSESEYFKTIELKTAWYLTMPMIGGAIIANASEDVIDKIKQFGMRIGPAFQITDDLLDLTKGKGRGEIGSDIREGKRTLMVVDCLKKCDQEERERMIEILNKPRSSTSVRDVLWVKSLFEKYGSIEYARKKAKNLAKEAKDIVRDLPEDFKNVLNEFADYLIERKR
jgi:geranylgeranyl pyrophosphate synthase